MVSSDPRTASRDRQRAVDALRAVVASLRHSARAVEQRTGATNAQVFVLQQLAREPGLCVRDVAERARSSESAASLVVARLVRAGLVTKKRSSQDARTVVLSLTAAGRRAVRHTPPPPTTRLLQAVESLDAGEVLALAAGLEALMSALGLAPAKAPLLFEEARRTR